MATSQSKIDILIAAKNTASPVLKQVAGDVGGLDRAAGVLSKGLGGLALAGGVAGIAALGSAAVSALTDLGRLGAQAMDVEVSFKQMAAASGEASNEMLSGLKESSRGAIADYDLMLTANRAMLLGVAQNTDDMTALMDVARARSQAMGMTTAAAFGDIITGIGRMSPMILDNLGIVVDQAAANDTYAESLGKTAAQLSDAEKKQALVNAVLRDSAELVAANAAAGDDMASKYERMDASITNAKVALGELFSPAIAAIAQSLANAVQGTADAIDQAAKDSAHNSLMDLGREIGHVAEEYRNAELGMAVALINPTLARAAQADLEAVRVEILRVGNEYNAAAAKTGAPLLDLDLLQQGVIAFNEASLGLNRMAAAAPGAAAGLGQVGFSADAAKERLAALKAQADETLRAINNIKSSAIGTLESAASSAVQVMGSSQVSQIYAEQKKRLDGQIDALERVGYNTDELRFKSEELARKAAEPFTVAVEAAREAEKGTRAYTASLSDAEKEANRAFDNIASMASSVLSGALNTGVASGDSLLESMGLREDAINEDARRLADVAVKGWDSPWADYFRTSHPGLFDDMFFGDIKAVAARQLKDFEDGLNPELIDKEKAKERVKRMIMGDQNMAQMAQEIAGEIAAEMGIPLQQALAATQGSLGAGGASGMAGTGAAQSFNEGATVGMEEGNGGGVMVDTFVAQARATYAKLKTAGSDAGKEWGNAFMTTVGENVPAALINLLANLVTPGVMAQFAQQGTLTGAQP